MKLRISFSRKSALLITSIIFALQACSVDESTSSLFKRKAPRKSKHQKQLTRLSVDYNYATAAQKVAEQDRTTIYLRVRDEKVLSAVNPIAKLRIENLHDYEDIKTLNTPITLNEGEVAQFDVEDLEPNRVYRIWVDVYQSNEGRQEAEIASNDTQNDQTSPDTAIGYIPLPYYWVTNGPSEVDQKRQIVVRDALTRYYYARKGWKGNMDCWQFCKFYAQKQFPRWNRRTHYGSSIPALAEAGPIHGDYVRIPDYHSFLILSYDSKNNTVWSVEGNFSNTIEVINRRLSSSWWVTHQK